MALQSLPSSSHSPSLARSCAIVSGFGDSVSRFLMRCASGETTHAGPVCAPVIGCPCQVLIIFSMRAAVIISTKRHWGSEHATWPSGSLVDIKATQHQPWRLCRLPDTPRTTTSIVFEQQASWSTCRHFTRERWVAINPNPAPKLTTVFRRTPTTQVVLVGITWYVGIFHSHFCTQYVKVLRR